MGIGLPDLLPCCRPAVLLSCCPAVLLSCYPAVLLSCYPAVLLSCCLLSCCLLLSYCPTVLPYHPAAPSYCAILLCYPTMPSYPGAILPCHSAVAVPFCRGHAIMPCHCAVPTAASLLYPATTTLLPCYPATLLLLLYGLFENRFRNRCKNRQSNEFGNRVKDHTRFNIIERLS